MKRTRRAEIERRAKVWAASWLESGLDTWDCWDGMTDEECVLVEKRIQQLADRLWRAAGSPKRPSDRDAKY